MRGYARGPCALDEDMKDQAWFGRINGKHIGRNQHYIDAILNVYGRGEKGGTANESKTSGPLLPQNRKK